MNPFESTNYNYAAILFYTLSISLILWVVTREISCWYFKINQRMKLLESINRNLEIIVEKLDTNE